MGVKKFSPDVLAELRKNPYVDRILYGYQVEFTVEFKELACQELMKGKKLMREILREHGINPEILGTYRIANFARTLRNKAKTGEGFKRAKCGRPKGHKRSDAIDEDKKLSAMKLCELRGNPYVLSVVDNIVTFTNEFKDLVCQEFLKEEKPIREILEYFGFDTQLLGASRVKNFSTKIRERCAKLHKIGQGVTNIQNVYNVSQKEREDITNGMDTNGSSHEECMKFLEQPQLPDAKAVGTEIEANNVSEMNQETGTLQRAFTEEERSVLLNNPYVTSVTNDAVQFTEEFKELAYQEFLQTKKTMREILQEHVIDPEILGSKRIWNFTSKLQEKAKKLQGFGDARTHNRRHPKCNPMEEKNLTERIRGLERELAYTRQEVEFLKKTQMVDMEARISWESKHRKK